ncbi:hypothetical protein GCM10027061_00050 [Nesterenkonia suensis]
MTASGPQADLLTSCGGLEQCLFPVASQTSMTPCWMIAFRQVPAHGRLLGPPAPAANDMCEESS